MKANGNFSDASVERLYSVRINRMNNLSDADNLGSPCDSLFGISGAGSPIRFHIGVILSKIVEYKPSYSV